MGVGIYLGLVSSGLVTAFVLTKLLKGITLICAVPMFSHLAFASRAQPKQR